MLSVLKMTLVIPEEYVVPFSWVFLLYFYIEVQMLLINDTFGVFPKIGFKLN